LAIHAEDPGILRVFRRPLETYADYLTARPPEAEAVAIAAAAEIAGASGVRLHVAHLSSALGLAAAREALQAGALISLETSPQYLWLTDQDFPRLGTAMKVLPPVRHAQDRAALVEALADGVIGIVATDHAPHTDDEKALPFNAAPAGSPGVQTLYLSCLELARRMGDVWLAPRWVSWAPARLAGLHDSKGTIAPGFDADLVLVDPNQKTVVEPAIMRSRQRHGALDGMELGFAVRQVYVRGVPAPRDGKRVARALGRMVRPSRGFA